MNDHEGWTVTYQKHFLINTVISFVLKTSIKSLLDWVMCRHLKNELLNLLLTVL